MTRRRLSLLVVLSLLIAGLSVAAWILWPRELTTVEAAVVGTWHTKKRPDGSHTVLVLNHDRTCKLSWLDGAGIAKTMAFPTDGLWQGNRISVCQI